MFLWKDSRFIEVKKNRIKQQLKPDSIHIFVLRVKVWNLQVLSLSFSIKESENELATLHFCLCTVQAKCKR